MLFNMRHQCNSIPLSIDCSTNGDVVYCGTIIIRHKFGPLYQSLTPVYYPIDVQCTCIDCRVQCINTHVYIILIIHYFIILLLLCLK